MGSEWIVRWFAAFWITVLATAAAAGVLALRGSTVPAVADGLRWLIPVGRIPWFLQAALIVGCWTVVRVVLQWAIAYTESATDAAPRTRPGKRARLGAFADRWFGNPTGRWLTFYAIVLGTVAALLTPLRFALDIAPALVALTALYAATLASAAAAPDRRQPLRAAVDPVPDPLLAMPGESESTP